MKKILLSLMAVMFAAISVNADDVKIVAVDPADGSELTNMPASFTVTFEDDATIACAKWQVVNLSKDADDDARVLTQGQLKKGENNVWSGKAYYVEALKMYAGSNYQLLVYPYATEDDANYETEQFGGALCQLAAATWVGTAAAYQYAEAQFVSVNPSPYATIISGEITAVFSAPVETVTATINGGIMGSDTPCEATPSEDKLTWTITIPESILNASTGSISMNVSAKDAEGKVVQGNVGEDADSYFVWEFNCYNACPVPSTVTPASGSTVEQIDVITIEDPNGINLSYSASSDIIVTKGMEYICTVPIECVQIAEGELGSKPTKLTVTLPKVITAPGNYQVIFPAMYFMIGEEFSSVVTKSFFVEYTIEGEEQPEKEGVAPVSISPADGATVSSLKTFEVTFPEGSFVGSDGTVSARLYTLSREEVGTLSVDYDWDAYEKCYLNLSEKVVKAGTYILVIPAGVFALDEDGTVFNKEVTYVYTVDGTEDQPVEVTEVDIVSIDPADGATVSRLNTFALMFPEGSYVDAGSATPQLYDSKSNLVTTGYVDYDWDIYEKAYIRLNNEVVEAGTYTLLIPTAAISLADDGSKVNSSAVYTFTVDGSAAGGETGDSYIIQMDLSANGGSITFAEDITFADNAETVECDVMSGDTKVATATLEYDAAEFNKAVVTFSPALEDGTYTIVFDGKITAFLTGTVMPIEPTEFTIGSGSGEGEGLTIIAYTLAPNGGTLQFDDEISFMGFTEELTVDVVNTETGNTVTTATLAYDAVDYTILVVTFADELPAGAYTMAIPDNAVCSFTTGAILPAQNVVFSIDDETAIAAIASNQKDVRYTLSGQKADANTKGILIINGKKVLVK